jgi:hypothetical protein
LADGGGPLEAVGNGEDLGQDRDLGRQVSRYPEDGCPGPYVEELRKAAEQVRRLGTAKRVPIVLQVAAQVIWETTLAVAAHPTGAVRRRHYSVPDVESATVVGNGASWPDRLYDSEVFVALDDGERGGPFHFGAGILDGLTSERVLVGAEAPLKSLL